MKHKALRHRWRGKWYKHIDLPSNLDPWYDQHGPTEPMAWEILRQNFAVGCILRGSLEDTLHIPDDDRIIKNTTERLDGLLRDEKERVRDNEDLASAALLPVHQAPVGARTVDKRAKDENEIFPAAASIFAAAASCSIPLQPPDVKKVQKPSNTKKGGQGQSGELPGRAQRRKKKGKSSTTLVWALRTYNSWSPLPPANDNTGILRPITFGTRWTTLRERRLMRVTPGYLTRCEKERTRRVKLRRPLSDEDLLKAYNNNMRAKRENREESFNNIIEAAGVSPTRKTAANQR